MKKLIFLFALFAIGALVYAEGKVFAKRTTFSGTIDTSLGGQNITARIDVGKTLDFANLVGDVVLLGPISAPDGYGVTDTGYIMLRTKKGLLTFTLDSVKDLNLPCSLHTSKMNGDTLIGDEVWLDFIVGDTGDVEVGSITYQINYQYQARP